MATTTSIQINQLTAATTIADTDKIPIDTDDGTKQATVATLKNAIGGAAPNNATITFTQGGTTKGSFTTNQSANATIALDAGGSGGAISGYVTAGQKAGTTLGANTTAEGLDTTSSGIASHAEGSETEATANCAHAEGYSTKAQEIGSHSEGRTTTASGMASHAEGDSTTASGEYSHAEGIATTASGARSHAEGDSSMATGSMSHAEGAGCEAAGQFSHAEGNICKTLSDGPGSHAEGFYTIAAGMNQHVQGKYNRQSNDNYRDAFIIGNGRDGARSNAFRVTFAGETYGLSAFNTTGADYAEYFEWQDGNPDDEDRVGYFVTMDGKQIIKADSNSDYILGVVSGLPAMIGNADEDYAHRWLKDDFGRFLTREVEETIPGRKEPVTSTTYVPNPDYDSSMRYVERKDRKEWSAVGMMGVLSVRDDGTCEVNGYCKPADGGIATKSTSKSDKIRYRVVKRVSENVVEVVVK